MNSLLWFQRDLRINNNPALNCALKQAKLIIAIDILHDECTTCCKLAITRTRALDRYNTIVRKIDSH